MGLREHRYVPYHPICTGQYSVYSAMAAPPMLAEKPKTSQSSSIGPLLLSVVYITRSTANRTTALCPFKAEGGTCDRGRIRREIALRCTVAESSRLRLDTHDGCTVCTVTQRIGILMNDLAAGWLYRRLTMLLLSYNNAIRHHLQPPAWSAGVSLPIQPRCMAGEAD